MFDLLLQTLRMHFVSALRHDDLFLPPGEIKITITIETTDIAGRDPVCVEIRFALFLFVNKEIAAAERMITVENYFSVSSNGNTIALYEFAYRAETIPARQIYRDVTSFSKSVTFKQRKTEASETFQSRTACRRSAGQHEPHAATECFVKWTKD